MKILLITVMTFLISQIATSETISCTGTTNDPNASENVKFKVEIKKDSILTLGQFSPFYKSTIKYYQPNYNGSTGLDLVDFVSTKMNTITFYGLKKDSRNLTINYGPDGQPRNVVMNYDSVIQNQVLDCKFFGILPLRPVCHESTANSKFLIEAIKNSDIDSIETNIECGANVNQTDKNGCTPLMIALEPACGAVNPVNYVSPFARTAQVVDTLIKNGAFVNTIDIKGESPLIKAAKMNISNVYDTFVALDADFNIQDNDGNTALMYAVFNGNLEVVHQLLNGDPDRRLKNKSGKTAYDIAKQWKKDFIIDLVRVADSSIVIKGNDDGTCSPLEITLKKGQVVDLTLKATNKMFKLESVDLGLEIMAENNGSSKKTLSVENEGQFKFTCGFHGANWPSEGVIIVH